MNLQDSLTQSTRSWTINDWLHIQLQWRRIATYPESNMKVEVDQAKILAAETVGMGNLLRTLCVKVPNVEWFDAICIFLAGRCVGNGPFWTQPSMLKIKQAIPMIPVLHWLAAWCRVVSLHTGADHDGWFHGTKVAKSRSMIFTVTVHRNLI